MPTLLTFLPNDDASPPHPRRALHRTRRRAARRPDTRTTDLPCSSRSFDAGGRRAKWKRGGSRGDGFVTGAAFAQAAGKLSAVADGELLAELWPPTAGVLKPSLRVHAGGLAPGALDALVLTGLLMAAARDEWRRVQSAQSRGELEDANKGEQPERARRHDEGAR